MIKNKVFYLNIFSFFLILFACVCAQTTPMPTTTPGTNSITYNSSEQKFYFYYNGIQIYSYFVGNGSTWDNCGATFNAIKAKAINGNWFWPSYVGGLKVILDNQHKFPWESGVQFERLNYYFTNETVTSEWRMKLNNDFIDYELKFKIVNRTLVLNIEVKNNSTKATGLHFDRSENSNKKSIVHIPYLNLLNVLCSDNSFTSFFVDWEQTNCSSIYPVDPSEYTVPDDVSKKSIRYSQHINYYPKTNGLTNQLKETLYLTVAASLDEVLPNIVAPYAPRREQAISKTIVSYGPPYTWMFSPPKCSQYNYDYFQEIKNRGVNDLGVIIKNYQKYGYDSGYPEILPANDWDKNNDPRSPECSNYLHPCKNTNNSKNQLLIDETDLLHNLGYTFALHENYVEVYENGSNSYSKDDISVNSEGRPVRGWAEGGCTKQDTSYKINTDKAKNYLATWSEKIRKSINPDFGYLDVSSGINPSELVDYDVSEIDAGKFKRVLTNVRSFADSLRTKYPGPIQGEGQNHFLYTGYFDDLEAPLFTGNYFIYGYKAPMLVDFDLRKLHSKSAFHGVGYQYLFFAPDLVKNQLLKRALTWDEILTNTATEIAFAHAGILAKAYVAELTIDQTVLEYNHTTPIAAALINATPISIQYGYDTSSTNLQTASEYIIAHPNYADITNPEFMGKVKVIYDNGIIVYVNRHPDQTWNVTVGSPDKWFSYHAFVNGQEQLYAGQSNNTSFVLPAKNGWVVYIPEF